MIALVRTELTKAVRRTRTYVIWLGLVALPLLIVVAIHARGNRRRRGEGEGLFRLAQQSGLLVPAAVLTVTSGFLLVVVAGTFAGDSVAGDAAWGNLRYLLMRPVPRGRLLVAKAFVAGVLIWTCTILVALAGLIGGVVLFGSHTVTVPTFVGGVFSGFRLSGTTLVVARWAFDGLRRVRTDGVTCDGHTVLDAHRLGRRGHRRDDRRVYRVGDPRRDTAAR